MKYNMTPNTIVSVGPTNVLYIHLVQLSLYSLQSNGNGNFINNGNFSSNHNEHLVVASLDSPTSPKTPPQII